MSSLNLDFGIGMLPVGLNLGRSFYSPHLFCILNKKSYYLLLLLMRMKLFPYSSKQEGSRVVIAAKESASISES